MITPTPPLPKVCSVCGLGRGEWLACELPDCGNLRAVEAEKTRQTDPVVESVGTETMNTTLNTTSQVGETPRAEETPLDTVIERMITQAFVSGQMDAQATRLEKEKIGRGGPLKALSRQAYELAEQNAGVIATEITTLRQQVKELQANYDSAIRQSLGDVDRIEQLEAEVKTRDEQIARLILERDSSRDQFDRLIEHSAADAQALREALEKLHAVVDDYFRSSRSRRDASDIDEAMKSARSALASSTRQEP